MVIPMLIEATGKPIRFRLRDGQEVLLKPGVPVALPEASARCFLEKAGAKVRLTVLTPIPPLQAGWLVVYRDRTGRLRGGVDERDAGTVQTCCWDGQTWMVTVRNGTPVPLHRITSVRNGDVGWTVREHGYDGEGPR